MGRRRFWSDKKKNYENRTTKPRERERERGGLTEGIGVQSHVPSVMNHAFSSPRNELECSVVAWSVQQINNVICSLGSRPIRSGPKDFMRTVGTEGRASEFRTFANQNVEREDEVRFSVTSASFSRANSASPPPHIFAFVASRYRSPFTALIF